MSKFPMPGSPVRGSKTGKPLMAVFDLLGRSWSIGILWQLSENGSATFRELQARCESVSPTVLNTRLKELRHAGLVERTKDGYGATSLGIELYETLAPLRNWSRKWAVHVRRRS
jgi:DNA-binding HxlR family transcriptional regulator